MDGILGRPRIATMIPGRGADQIRERNPSFYVTISSGSADRKLTHHHVISRVSGIVSTIRSLRSLVPWSVAVQHDFNDPSNTHRRDSFDLPSRNPRAIHESLFFFRSYDRSIEIGGSKLNRDDDDCGIKVEGMSKIGAKTIRGTKIALSRDRGRFVERAEVAATLFPREKRPFPSRGIN